MKKSDELKNLEGRILKEEEVIEAKEKEILKIENKILSSVEDIQSKDKILSKAGYYRRKIVRKLARHRFLFSILVSISFVLVWRGLWDITASLPILEDAGVALIIGFFMVWLLERYTEE